MFKQRDVQWEEKLIVHSTYTEHLNYDLYAGVMDIKTLCYAETIPALIFMEIIHRQSEYISKER